MKGWTSEVVFGYPVFSLRGAKDEVRRFSHRMHDQNDRKHLVEQIMGCEEKEVRNLVFIHFEILIPTYEPMEYSIITQISV